jgi:hypothetical protein
MGQVELVAMTIIHYPQFIALVLVVAVWAESIVIGAMV